MGSCLCLRLSEHVVDDEDDAAPYKWAVINPRPSLARLRGQQQCQTQQQVSERELIMDQYNPTGDHSTAYTRSLTCLEILEQCSRKSEDFDSYLSHFQQKEFCSREKSTGIPSQIVGSPVASILTPHQGEGNERSCFDDQPLSSTLGHVFKSESTFSNITTELGESDKSSSCGSPKKPLVEKKYVHRANEQEPKFRKFSPKYSKLRISKQLPSKYCASEQETLLQKSPPEQCQE